MEKNLNEQPNNTIENKKPKKTYQNPLFLTLGDISEKAVTLNNNKEIINYLVDEVPENELKKYILYFLSKAEKIETPKYYSESCKKLLLEKSEEGKNICIDRFHNGKHNYSLGIESEYDSFISVFINSPYEDQSRADYLVDKIKDKKELNKSLKDIPNIIEEGNKYIKDEELNQYFNKVINLIKDLLNNGNKKALNYLSIIKKGLEYLEKIEKGESREKIESEIKKENCSYIFPFLIIFIERGKTDIFLKCVKMEYDWYKKTYPLIDHLKDLGLTEDATIVDIGNRLREKQLKNNREYRSTIEKKLSRK